MIRFDHFRVRDRTVAERCIATIRRRRDLTDDPQRPLWFCLAHGVGVAEFRRGPYREYLPFRHGDGRPQPAVREPGWAPALFAELRGWPESESRILAADPDESARLSAHERLAILEAAKALPQNLRNAIAATVTPPSRYQRFVARRAGRVAVIANEPQDGTGGPIALAVLS